MKVSTRVRLWLQRFAPAPAMLDWRERLRVSCGAILGIALTGFLMQWWLAGATGHLPLLIAPLGASAVLLFAVPASPLAQPWALLGGNTIAALIGVTCAHWLGDSLPAAAVAVGTTIAATIVLRCVHPPAGAVALTAVLGGPAIQAAGYGFALNPVGINSLLLLLCAMLYHAATGHRYPHTVAKTADAKAEKPAHHLGFNAADLDAVLKNQNEILDIDRDDLESLLRQAEMMAYRRRFGEIYCGDIMSRQLVTVEFGSFLEEAWALLREHRIKALPVIDRSRRVIGIVTLADFMRHAQLDSHAGFARKLRNFVARITTLHADKPDVVGQIMTTAVSTAPLSKPIVELVPIFADSGHHHIPIVDDERRLVGIVTQSDLVLALYEQRSHEQPPQQERTAQA
ncbi:MAG TPA: HPP family protein [Spongiibacteraceae bacterium]|nr:HPP family protein [Spongiibacteraceae bacterium]